MTEGSVFLSLGSNSGNRADLLKAARAEIARQAGVILKESGIYETEPWGNTDQPLFLNQVLQISTALDETELLDKILSIEKKLGRERGRVRWLERTMDIDILFYASRISHLPGLMLPHPELQKRRFILVPLAEIAGTFKHPVLNKSISELLMECDDPLTVSRI